MGMRIWISLLLAVSAIPAYADDPTLGIVRGLFLSYQGSAAAGVVTVKLVRTDLPA